MINNARYAIYALANDLESARKIAIDKAPASAKETVSKIVNENAPVVHSEPTSFIQGSNGQLI